MNVGIKELKRRYRENLALGRVLPTHDLGVPLPLSTGNPLFDAAMTEKLAATTTLDAPEHLARAWHMVQKASAGERAMLAEHANALLNDWKLLLALRAWELGELDEVRRFVRALPWGWRLAFPTCVVNPAAQLFTGWRKRVSFRLVADPKWGELRTYYRELLAAAPGTALLKYRTTVQEAMALLHYRPEGDRETAIHDLAFARGDSVRDPSLEPIGTYVRAREALKTGGVVPFLDVIGAGAELPITSYMGLLGSAGIRIKSGGPYATELRNQAVKCATPVESLLRLKEWSPWLTDEHIEQLSARVRHAVIEKGFDIPFAKVLKAFLGSPQALRKRVRDPLLAPLLRHFGTRVASLLPPPGPIAFVMPVNVVHLTSFLLYATLAAAAPAQLVLVKKKGATVKTDFGLEQVISHLTDETHELQRWLLATLGGASTVNEYTYDTAALAKVLDKIDPAAPVVLDMPFMDSMDILTSLIPRERVFNLNTAFGAPGEICVAYEYYQRFALVDDKWSYRVWSRWSDGAASRFAELLEKLGQFERLAKATA
ncbi:MAG TPA: hypothetical protein VL326_17895 [Kofleriaceae bacterium]|nr:hypothetical protein [Kofleriaceae bacterium]